MRGPLSHLQSETQANSAANEIASKPQSCSLQLGLGGLGWGGHKKKGEEGRGCKKNNKSQKLDMESAEGTLGGGGNGVLKRNLEGNNSKDQ